MSRRLKVIEGGYNHYVIDALRDIELIDEVTSDEK